jgi:serine protease Do
VDLNGNLIGINTAIASQTGTYSGYGFAVPANLASRVVSDLIQYGSPQRGYLGVQIHSVDGNFARQQNLKTNEGAFVSSVMENGAAQKAGIKANDVVVSIDNKKVNSSSDLMEIVGSHRIGDKLTVKVNRDGEVKEFEVALKNQAGTAVAVTAPKEDKVIEENLGATLVPLDEATAARMGIRYGVQVKNLTRGILAESEIEEGFVITKVNKEPVYKPVEVIAKLKNSADGTLIEGYYPGQSQKQYYAIAPR